jgi:hypothetical protein
LPPSIEVFLLQLVLVEHGALHTQEVDVFDLVIWVWLSLDLDEFAISMSQSVCPRSSEALFQAPNHLTLAVPHILLVFSSVEHSLRPVKLPYAVHLSVFPCSVVAFTVKPKISSVALEDIMVKVALIML